MTLVLLITAAAGAWATEPKVINSEIDFESLKVGDILVEGFSISGPNSVRFYFNAGRAKKGETLLNEDVSFYRYYISSVGTNTVITLSADAGDAAGTYTPIDENGQVANAWIVTSTNGSGNSDFHLSGYKYVAPTDEPTEPAIDVTINNTNTEASFEMPTYDVTVNYELVRDMSVQMTTTMGDGTNGLRYRVKKNEQTGKYKPADMDMMQVVALVAVNDGIEQKDLTLNQDYFCRIYKLDEQTLQPEGDGVELFDFDFAPGLYALKAIAKDGSNYDGETALSNTFKLFQGYEVTVPAGEYVTYYKNEALYVEDTEAQLYTITAVSGATATADELTIAPANTPLLVKNNGATEKTIVLIPTTTNTPDNVTAYSGFTGTLEATQIAASTTTQNNYAFNGKEFVWVKTALNIAANKAWLEVPVTASAAPQIRLIFSSTTGIESVDREQSTVDGWYDLNGRRLPGKPTKKGVYIVNGKKMVVK